MSLRAELDKLDTEAMPDLKHGVPGLQLFHRDAPDHAARRGPSARQEQLDKLASRGESWAFYLGLVVAVAVVLRVLIVLIGPMGDIERAFTDSTAVELQLAQNLAERGSFGLAAQPPDSLEGRLDTLREERGSLPLPDAHGLRPETYRAPGYPLVLAIFTFTGLPLTLLLLGQCALGGAAVALTYGLAKVLARSKGVAMAAATLTALHPGLVVAAAVLDPLIILVTLVLTGLLAAASTGRVGVRGTAGGGVALGAAALFLPTLLWLAPLVAAWLALSERNLKAMGLAAALLVGAALPIGGWMVRNHSVGLDPRVAATPGVDRLFHAVARLDGPMEASAAAATRNALLAELRTEGRLPRYADRSLFDAMDRLSAARLWERRAATWTLMQDAAAGLLLDHSAERMHRVLGVEYIPAGAAERFLGRDTPRQAEADPATRPLIAAWVGLNAVLAVAAVLGATLLLIRRRVAAVVLAVVLGGLAWWIATTQAGGPSEAVRLILLPLQAMLVGGLCLALKSPAPTADRSEPTPPAPHPRRPIKDLPHPALALGYPAPTHVPTPTGRPI